MGIKHVFFDLDHTLWDFEKNSDLAFQKIFKKQKIELNLNNFLEVYKPLNLQYWKLYREEKVTKSELRYQRLKKTFYVFTSYLFFRPNLNSPEDSRKICQGIFQKQIQKLTKL